MPLQPHVESGLQLYALDAIQVTMIRFCGISCVLVSATAPPFHARTWRHIQAYSSGGRLADFPTFLTQVDYVGR